jgi:hypothetical protein
MDPKKWIRYRDEFYTKKPNASGHYQAMSAIKGDSWQKYLKLGDLPPVVRKMVIKPKGIK